MMMKAGMWNAYTTVYAASMNRLSPLMGSQKWPTATSTIARYLALSKNASRRFLELDAPLLGVSVLGVSVLEVAVPGGEAGGSGVLRLPFGRGESVTGPPARNSGRGSAHSLRFWGTGQRGTSEAP
ncbi:hypothetical protein GCM10027162_62180 [Streptomyces incanus]